MSLLWMDGFDHYGDDESKMLDGAWAEYFGATWGNAGSAYLDTAKARTGARAIHFKIGIPFGSTYASGQQRVWWRRVFGENKVRAGVGLAIYMDELPANPNRIGVSFCDENNAAQLTCYVLPTGAWQVYRGGIPTSINGSIGTLLGTSAVALVAKGWNHVEIWATADDAAGAVEIRVNGVTVINLTGIDTVASSLVHFAQVRYGEFGWRSQDVGMQADWYIEDLFAADDQGLINNDFIGDKKVYTKFPDADTTTQDWIPSTGATAWEILSNNPADDAEFLTADNPGDTLIEEVEDLPADVVSIAGIMPTARAWKTDAGNAKIQLGMLSGSSLDVGVEHALSMAISYHWDVFELDPDTGAAWTVEGYNAAQVQVERTE